MMVVRSIDIYKDGGTFLVETDQGNFYIDRRFGTDLVPVNPSKGFVFKDYPERGRSRVEARVERFNRPMGRLGHEIDHARLMNIKLIHNDGRWYVVVNSLAGEFTEEVTGQIMQAILIENNQETIKRMGAEKAARLADLEEAVTDAFSSLRSVVSD
jgi:hypothetical protein